MKKKQESSDSYKYNAISKNEFSKATRMRPGSAEAHYGLGLAYQEAGQNGNAKTEYQKVIELDPNGRDAAEVKALLRRLE